MGRVDFPGGGLRGVRHASEGEGPPGGLPRRSRLFGAADDVGVAQCALVLSRGGLPGGIVDGEQPAGRGASLWADPASGAVGVPSGRLPRSGRVRVAEELACSWAAVMSAVTVYGTPLVDDPARVAGVELLGVDETSLLKARPGRRRVGCPPRSTWAATG